MASSWKVKPKNMAKKPKESKTFINLAVVLNPQGKVLLVKRKKPEKGKEGAILGWAFPGGRQRLKETRKECVEREVLAETGYQISAEKEVSLRYHPEFPVVVVYHLGKLLKKRPVTKPKEPWEIEEICWVEPSKIRELITSNLDSKVAEQLEI